MNKKEKLDKLLELDKEARSICKPLGCKVMKCLKANGAQECSGMLAVLNQCLDTQKRELAPKYGLAETDYK